MIKKYAKIENNIVVNIVIVNEEDVPFLPGFYLETVDDGSIRYNSASIGSQYDIYKDAFINPKPFPEWILNEETLKCEAPDPKPEDGSYV